MLNKQLDTETTDRTGIPLRVLVVEDNPRDAELQIATLARAGYLVQHKVAPTADIFRQTLGQLDFDIILADYICRTGPAWTRSISSRRAGKTSPSSW